MLEKLDYSLPYELRSFLENWLEARELASIFIAYRKHPTFFGDQKYNYNIVDRFVERARLADYEWLVRESLKSKIATIVLAEEKIRRALLNTLTLPDANIKYRLLAVNFLNENTYKLELSSNECLEHCGDDPTFYLLYGALPSSIDAEKVTEGFKRCLKDTETEILNAAKHPDTQLIAKNKKTVLDLAVLNLHAAANKFDKLANTQALACQLLELYRLNAKHHNVWPSWESMRLLALPLANTGLRKYIEFIHLLLIAPDINTEDEPEDFFTERFLSQLPPTFMMTHRNAIMKLLLHALLGNFPQQRNWNLARAAKIFAAFSPNLQNTADEARLSDLLNATSNDNSQSQAISVRPSALASLWNCFQDAHRESLTSIGLSFLRNNNTLLKKSSIPILIQSLLTLQPEDRKAAIETWLHLHKAEDRKYAIQMLTPLWLSLNSDERAAILSAGFSMAIKSSDGYDASTLGIAALVPVLSDLQPVELRIVIDTFMRALKSTRAGVSFRALNAIEPSSLQHFQDTDRNQIISVALDMLKHDSDHLRDKAKKIIAWYIPEAKNAKISKMTKKLTLLLSHNNGHVRITALDLFSTIISHHPHYKKYNFEAIENPLQKNCLIQLLELTRKALNKHVNANALRGPRA